MEHSRLNKFFIMKIRTQIYVQSLDEKGSHSIVYEYKVPIVVENKKEREEKGSKVGYCRF